MKLQILNSKLYILYIAVAVASVLFVNNAKAVTISPLNFELTGNPGDTVSNVVRIYNDLDVGIGVTMEAQDFVSAGEQGQVLIKGHEESNTYSLESWISLSPQTFSLAPHSSQMVEFTVKIPAGGEPGGHYASVLATVSGETPGGGVGINQKVGALLLLSVAGEISENLGLVDFNPDSDFTEYGPEKLIARFKNDGTVHLKPRGFVIIKNVLGNEVVKMELPQLNVLPQSARTVDIPLKLGNQFGRYEATLAAIYGATNEPLSAITVYWVIPYKLLAVYGGILLAFLIAAYMARKRIGLALRILFRGEQKS